MKVYGNNYDEGTGYSLATHLWGFKFEDGQNWLEYLLEYLNVLAGFDYRLARGIKRDDSNREPEKKDVMRENARQEDEKKQDKKKKGKKQGYRRFSRLGLRRFVFYDASEKKRHAYDDRALELLQDKLKEKTESMGDAVPLEVLRDFLQSFSCVEGNRPWLARSLFPLHEKLLFFEGYRKSSKKPILEVAPETLDKDISFGQRNFYGRGGELYYLMLSAGTMEKYRNSIVNRFKELLQDSSSDIGAVADFVDSTWQEILTEAGGEERDIPRGQLGWLPDPDCSLYPIMAEDVKVFLSVAIEPLEKIHLLAYLVAFHIIIYIYHRAHPNANSAAHSARGRNKCTNTCRLALLIDASENNESKIIRNESRKLYQAQEVQIVDKAKDYLEGLLEQWGQDILASEPSNPQEMLEGKLFGHFNLSRKQKDGIQAELDTLTRQNADFATVMMKIAVPLEEMLIKQLRKDLLPVPRKLAKDIGFVSPKQGAGARFTLSDNLLKVLTLSNVRRSMTYADFLAHLYRRYGLVVDIAAAHASKLYERLNINQEYYQKNADLLLERMLNAGLAQQYSDATAMISAHRLVMDDE